MSPVRNITAHASPVTASFIGAGNYGASVLLPAFRKAGAKLITVGDRGGLLSWLAAKENGAQEASTDIEKIFTDDRINTIVIATRHNTHSDLVCRALDAGKNVFVEKPLALSEGELQEIESCLNKLETAGRRVPKLMVGFNRRFAPHCVRLKAMLRERREPLAVQMTVNAGSIPLNHWVHDVSAGGGRIVGEGCHFIDLMRFLVAAPIQSIYSTSLGGMNSGPSSDKVTVVLNFADGSVGTLNYLANGHASYPKEHLEVFCAGRVYRIKNWVRLTAYGQPGFSKHSLWRQDKGQLACAAAFVNAIAQGGNSPIPLAELMEVARATFKIKAQLKSHTI